jgi:hypothetical protein
MKTKRARILTRALHIAAIFPSPSHDGVGHDTHAPQQGDTLCQLLPYELVHTASSKGPTRAVHVLLAHGLQLFKPRSLPVTRMNAQQVIAILPNDDDSSFNVRHDDFLRHGATALVRDENGRISLETITASSSFLDQVLTTGCFRRGKPIVDPVSRQVMGYEMEMIATPGALKPRYATA